MIESTAPALETRPRRSASPRPGRGARSRATWLWLAVAVAVVVVAFLFVLISGMRPAFDAYGWLVWGHQALQLDLNTNAAPSWKPLTFLFTFLYALFGQAALWFWMVTAVSAAASAAIFGGRIAYHLTADGPRWTAFVAAVLAGVGVLGIEGFGHFVLIAYSDPMIVALCLAAVDFHLRRRQRVAFVMLALAALGRPEVWIPLMVYAVWSWRSVPAMRREVAIGLAAVVVLWFGVPILTAHDWFSAGDVASTSSTPIHGDKITGVINRFLSLYELPMQLAVLVALGLAAFRRDLNSLILAAIAVLWVAVEIGFALHGWAASKRYLFEPAAVAAVLAAVGMARLLALASVRSVVRWIGVAAVVGFLAAMAPHAQIRLRLLHNGIVLGRQWAIQIHRLQTVVAKAGGTKGINACGQPVTTVSFQSILAWETGENVSGVGWSPPYWTFLNRPIVVFNPIGAGWVVTPVHTAPDMVKSCARLNLKTSFSAKTPGARVLTHKPTD